LFAYCQNNPVNFTDPTGEFVITPALIAVAIGGALGGAFIGAVSYITNCGIAGEEVTASGVITYATLGGITGAIGAVGGAIGTTAAVKFSSALVGLITGVVTLFNTEGSVVEKVTTGVTAGVLSAYGTFLGTKIPVALDNSFTAGVTSFAGGLFMGTNAEIFSVATQKVVSYIFDTLDDWFSTSDTRKNHFTGSILR
jgi:hypothetical protein